MSSWVGSMTLAPVRGARASLQDASARVPPSRRFNVGTTSRFARTESSARRANAQGIELRHGVPGWSAESPLAGQRFSDRPGASRVPKAATIRIPPRNVEFRPSPAEFCTYRSESRGCPAESGTGKARSGCGDPSSGHADPRPGHGDRSFGPANRYSGRGEPSSGGAIVIGFDPSEIGVDPSEIGCDPVEALSSAAGVVVSPAGPRITQESRMEEKSGCRGRDNDRAIGVVVTREENAAPTVDPRNFAPRSYSFGPRQAERMLDDGGGPTQGVRRCR